MNIPDCFSNAKRILFAGVGGGFDIFTALPLWVKLEGKEFVFSNYNGHVKKLTTPPESYPEERLNALLLKNKFEIPFYVLPKVGVKSYLTMYKEIVKTHNIDTVVAVDGGVDSLMHGDEDGAGTILEDFANLIALDQIECDKFLVCAGFGSELEEDVCHHHVLENIAQLCENGGFLGSCSLLNGSKEFEVYKDICDWVWADGRKSHVQTKVISAAVGVFGAKSLYDNVEANVFDNVGSKNYISPLTSMYWFFDLHKVMQKNVLYDTLNKTATSTDLLMAYRQSIDAVKKRPRKVFPY